MKRIKLLFLTLVLVAICGAFATKQNASGLVKKYRIEFCDGFRLYVEDITDLEKGVEYDCSGGSNICTFITFNIPFFDPDYGLFYFDPSIVWFALDIDWGDYIDYQ